MHSDPTPSHTTISNRLYRQFTYPRTPTEILPVPTIPERISLPEAGIHEVFEVRIATDDATEKDVFGIRWDSTTVDFANPLQRLRLAVARRMLAPL